ncbi:MAG: dimethylsulfonioproprionate lyase family protein [Pseudomonadota bacterium]
MTVNANSFRDVFVAALGDHLATSPGVLPLINALSHDGMISALSEVVAASPSQLGRAAAGLDDAQPLAAQLRAILPTVCFYAFLEEADVDPVLAAGLFAGQIGYHSNPPARLGLFLLGPGVYYPPHQHAAEEIYYCAAGSLTLQHGTDGTPFDLKAGELSVTPSHRVHALSTGDTPCLLIYAWAGDVTAPAWWWDQDGEGAWHRTRWSRRADGRWLQETREAVTGEVRQEAGEL